MQNERRGTGRGSAENTSAGRRLLVCRIVLAAAAVILIAAGIALGDTAVIFHKAIFICMECIGIA